MSLSQKSIEVQVNKLKRVRAGKKGSVTKRIEQLTRLVSEGGSRTKIKYLFSALEEKYKEVGQLCVKIESLTDEEDTCWLEEVKMRFDSCAADVYDYLEARKDDPPSTSPNFTAS